MSINIRAKRILQLLENDISLVPPGIAAWWIKYLKNSEIRYLDTLNFLDKNYEGKKLLEIGCLPGHFTVLLKTLGYDIHGVDKDPSRVQQLWDKYGISVMKVDIEQDHLPFPTNYFDTVLFTELIEHLRIDPLHALREVYNVLKPAGKIILSTPNITPVHRLRFLLGYSIPSNIVDEFKKLDWLGHMGHFRLYSLKEIIDFLEYVGFKIEYYKCKGPFVYGRMAKILMTLYPKKENYRCTLYVVGRKK